ncbi:hypothetical protein N7530_003351 [Penicillium desertorum]|uniref:Uncharacterized protein n=1 Tax=Penicillium desertorum TaxID=1303715 RepID=A0A9W9WWJ5_9EURO|nr:hypothetical protein N7530_003351 [Penicillium desertorum]
MATQNSNKTLFPPKCTANSSQTPSAHSKRSQPDSLTNGQQPPPSPPESTITPLGFAILHHGDSCTTSESEQH